jgi:hypothetical protein
MVVLALAFWAKTHVGTADHNSLPRYVGKAPAAAGQESSQTAFTRLSSPDTSGNKPSRFRSHIGINELEPKVTRAPSLALARKVTKASVPGPVCAPAQQRALKEPL